jgi:hypothetical protein
MVDIPGYQGGHFYHQFCEVSESLENSQESNAIDWSDSSFEWLFKLPPKSKGVVFERIVRNVLERNGVWVDDRSNSKHDFQIAGLRVEIKVAFATMFSNTDEWGFVWNAIKTSGYDYILLFCVLPHRLELVFMSREELLSFSDFENQEYIENMGLCLGGAASNGICVNIMEAAGDFEESFEKVVSFFKEQCRDILLMTEDGECLTGG